MSNAVFGSSTRVPGALFVLLLHAAFVSALILSLGHVPVGRPLPPVEITLETEGTPPPPSPPPVVIPSEQPPLTAPPVVVFGHDGPGGLYAPQLVAPASMPGHANRRPDYPQASIRLGEEGSVVLLLLVGKDGRVADGRVESSSGFSRLDDAALSEARRSYRFRPGTENGQPKAMWHRVKITFRLDDIRG